MQSVLQGYLGLLQGEKMHLYSINNDRDYNGHLYGVMVYKAKKHKRFNFIIFLTFFSSKLNIILKKSQL